MNNVATQYPERLEFLKGAWGFYAGVYTALPLDDRSALEIMSTARPQLV